MTGEVVTDRLVLRPFDADEATAVRHGHRRPEWAPQYPAEPDIDVAGMVLEAGSAPLYGQWQLVDRADRLVVGTLVFVGGSRRETVNVGYAIVDSHRNHGLATAAVEVALHLARDLPGVTRVSADAHVDNLASQRVLEKAGFILIGREAVTIHYEYDLHPAVR